MVYFKNMTTNDIKDYLKFKATQFFRLRGIKIPKEAEKQKELLDTIPQEVKKQWAMEVIQMGA
jgi:hypothetical protein